MSLSKNFAKPILGIGSPYPLGATPDDHGVNFAIFSQHAEKIELCLFDEKDHEALRIPLESREGNIWHVHVGGLGPGQKYGYRVHGPYEPAQGLRFNANKLLIDPYARAWDRGCTWSPEVTGYVFGSDDLSFDERDTSGHVPKSVVLDTRQFPPIAPAPKIADEARVIYELHVKGFTRLMEAVPPEIRGTYEGLASDAAITYLKALGVTTIELLPIHAFVTDLHLVERGLTNYWGYQSMGYFTPDRRYARNDAVSEFRGMVSRLHEAGFEVILDVVYNHTGEGNEKGPTLSFRGIDNAAYYRLTSDKRYYLNDAGTGNTLNLDHPDVLRMVLDSLRYWVQEMGVDGFRFDLATTLGRETSGFATNGAFLKTIKQDPLLSRTLLIAEPWDIGPGGYQLGGFPAPFKEWNDKYRDDVRRYWRKDSETTANFSRRILGSAELFDQGGRKATSSVNFIAAHDGFTLYDTTAYLEKHNLDNLEENRDGHSENLSDNFGIEGPSSDPLIEEKRKLRMRNFLTTLFLSQGTPMLLAGDEVAHSQKGNNNAYAQDNEISWIEWGEADLAMLTFTKSLIALRRSLPILRQSDFLHSLPIQGKMTDDLKWYLPNGQHPTVGDWHDPNWRAVGVMMRTSALAPSHLHSDDALFMIFNSGDEVEFQLPIIDHTRPWRRVLDSKSADFSDQILAGPHALVSSDTVCLFRI